MVIGDDKVSQCSSHFLDWTQLTTPIWYVTKRIFHKTMFTLLNVIKNVILKSTKKKKPGYISLNQI